MMFTFGTRVRCVHERGSKYGRVVDRAADQMLIAWDDGSPSTWHSTREDGLHPFGSRADMVLTRWAETVTR